MPLDPNWAKIAVDIAQFVATAGVGLYVYIADRDRARASALQDLETEIDRRMDGVGERLARIETASERIDWQSCGRHDSRLASLEEHMRHAPSVADIKEAHQRMDVMSDGLAEMRGGLKRIERTLEIISEHMLERR